ncbi:hypothetical protein HK099_006001, partial [Clydaea vesicula]
MNPRRDSIGNSASVTNANGSNLNSNQFQRSSPTNRSNKYIPHRSKYQQNSSKFNNSSTTCASPHAQSNFSIDSAEALAKVNFVLLNLVGTKVTVHVKNGNIYEGLFHTAITSDNLGVCLKMAHLLVNGKVDGAVIPSLIILGRDVCGLSAIDIDLSACAEEDFKTDAVISGNTGEVRERKLEKWEPASAEGELESLENANPDEHWDQFAANQKLFGVSTDFDENLYTTVLDKSGPDFKRKEMEAIRVAGEINRTSTKNIHLAEERGQNVDDSGGDEEDKYSSVLRSGTPGKYVPPGAQKASSKGSTMNQNKISPPQPHHLAHSASHGGSSNSQKSNQKERPTSVAFDGSSSWADDVSDKNAPPLKPAWGKPIATSQPKKSSNAAEKSQPIPATTSASLPRNKASTLEKKENAQQQPHQTQKVTPAGTGSKSPTKAFKGILDQRVPANQTDTSPVQPLGAVEPVSKAFSKFAQEERMSVLNRREKEKKKEIVDVISDLKSFSQTFKLKTPIPEDLQEIFSKNKAATTSSGSLNGNENTPKISTNVPVKNNTNNGDKVTKTVPVTTAATSNASAASKNIPSITKNVNQQDGQDKSVSNKSSSSSFRFNPKAFVFKPNPNATAFVPTSGSPAVEKNPFFGTKQLDKTPLSINTVYQLGYQQTPNSPPSQTQHTWPFGQNVSYVQQHPPVYPQNSFPQPQQIHPAMLPYQDGQFAFDEYGNPVPYGPYIPMAAAYGFRPIPMQQRGNQFPPFPQYPQGIYQEPLNRPQS